MAFTEFEQIKKLLADKKHILVTFRPEAGGDAIASAAALHLWLENLGKRVTVAAQDFHLPTHFQFLKTARTIQSGLGQLQKSVITVDVTKTGVQELSYDVKNNQLRIFITPKNGAITEGDIHATQSDYTYDLVITLNTPDLAALGTMYAHNPDFFYKTTVINADHEATNEHYGQLNVIDLTMSTTAELLFRVLQKLAPEHLSPDVATALLTGMIAGTNSFKKNNVRPQTLAAASELVALGADRTYIVKNLFETKSVATFKLWGAALSHLEHDVDSGLVWSTLTRDDFVRTGAADTDLPAIIDELIANIPTARVIVLLHEHPETTTAGTSVIHGIVQINNGGNALALLTDYEPRGDKTRVTFAVKNGSLRDTEVKLIASLKEKLKQ